MLDVGARDSRHALPAASQLPLLTPQPGAHVASAA